MGSELGSPTGGDYVSMQVAPGCILIRPEDRFVFGLQIVIVKGEFPRLIHSPAMMGSVVRFDAAVDGIVVSRDPLGRIREDQL
jgi:hypothetical protein